MSNSQIPPSGKIETKGLFRQAISLFGLLTIVTGAVYPLAVTGVAQLALSEQANGSLLRRDGEVIGSALIGQSNSDPGHFWGRPSATSRVAYDGAASTGSNLGPLHTGLHEAIAGRAETLQASGAHPVPIDLVTASGSGLDPHISPAAARYQVERVAQARGVDVAAVERLVSELTEEPTLGLLGAPRVNVLRLNLALDAAFPPHESP